MLIFLKTQQLYVSPNTIVLDLLVKEYNYLKFSFWTSLNCWVAVLEILTSVHVCSGVPVWLHYVPGTVFRTDSEPFKVCALLFLCSNSVEPYLCYFDNYLLSVVHPSHLFQLYMYVFFLTTGFCDGDCSITCRSSWHTSWTWWSKRSFLHLKEVQSSWLRQVKDFQLRPFL